MSNKIGVRIRAARNMFDPKLTQDDLIALLHTRHNIIFTKSGISRIENGERYVTDLELIAFADVLKVSTAWLLGETADSYTKKKILKSPAFCPLNRMPGFFVLLTIPLKVRITGFPQQPCNRYLQNAGKGHEFCIRNIPVTCLDSGQHIFRQNDIFFCMHQGNKIILRQFRLVQRSGGLYPVS